MAADRLNEFIDNLMQLHKGDQYNRTETEGKDSANKDNAGHMPHAGQLNKHAYTESADTIRQSENRTYDIHEHSNQTKN